MHLLEQIDSLVECLLSRSNRPLLLCRFTIIFRNLLSCYLEVRYRLLVCAEIVEQLVFIDILIKCSLNCVVFSRKIIDYFF